jgi:hypothetical protein
MMFITILNYFKFVTFRMACKRSSVRLRYSPHKLNALRYREAFCFPFKSNPKVIPVFSYRLPLPTGVYACIFVIRGNPIDNLPSKNISYD